MLAGIGVSTAADNDRQQRCAGNHFVFTARCQMAAPPRRSTIRRTGATARDHAAVKVGDVGNPGWMFVELIFATGRSTGRDVIANGRRVLVAMSPFGG
jgi:hypothetical protein